MNVEHVYKMIVTPFVSNKYAFYGLLRHLFIRDLFPTTSSLPKCYTKKAIDTSMVNHIKKLSYTNTYITHVFIFHLYCRPCEHMFVRTTANTFKALCKHQINTDNSIAVMKILNVQIRLYFLEYNNILNMNMNNNTKMNEKNE